MIKAKKKVKPSVRKRNAARGLRSMGSVSSSNNYSGSVGVKKNISSVIGMTASQRTDLKTGLRFIGNSFTNFGIEFVVPWMNVGFPGSTAASSARMANSTNYVTYSQVTPTNGHDFLRLNKAVGYLADMFTKWTPLKLEFIYETNCPTTTQDRLAFGYNTDPQSEAILLANSAFSDGSEKFYAMLDQKYSKCFAPWENWTMTIDDQDLQIANKFITNKRDGADNEINAVSLSDRLSEVGIANIRSMFLSDDSQFPSTQPTTYGILYLRMRVKFWDIASAVFTFPFGFLSEIPTNVALSNGKVIMNSGELIRVEDYLMNLNTRAISRSFPHLSKSSLSGILVTLRTDYQEKTKKEKERDDLVARAVRIVSSDIKNTSPPCDSSVNPVNVVNNLSRDREYYSLAEIKSLMDSAQARPSSG